MPWFWQALILLIVTVPIVVMFGYAAWDVVRRPDIRVLHRAVWLVAFCIFPIVGPIAYLVIRPPGTTATERALATGGKTSTDELMRLADLHDRGKLTDQEFEAAKQQHIEVGMAEIPTSVLQQRPGGA